MASIGLLLCTAAACRWSDALDCFALAWALSEPGRLHQELIHDCMLLLTLHSRLVCPTYADKGTEGCPYSSAPTLVP
jgi:hypothetical protein